MHNRRSFLKQSAIGILGMSMPGIFNMPSNQIKIGIIGAENSHTIGFGKTFNVNQVFPGVSVEYVWGETEEFAIKAMEEGQIPNRVIDPNEMLGKIDALIVDHRHGKFHLDAAMPFIESGIPTFIDKPFCYRLEAGSAFLQKAKAIGTPVTSYSSIAHSEHTFDMKHQIEAMSEIGQVVMYGPCDIESPYGGVFFYGPHLVEPIIYLFGLEVEKVRMTDNGKNSSAQLIYKNGMPVTLIFTKNYKWQLFVSTGDALKEISSRLDSKVPGKNDVDMVNMFKTGKEPRSHESILTGIAVLEALERSLTSQTWEKIEPV